MNTVEPEHIAENRGLAHQLRNYINDPTESDINKLETLNELELERNKWFLSVLERDTISNEEEDKIKIWNELDIYGYAYIGKIKVSKFLFKVLYKLKLTNL